MKESITKFDLENAFKALDEIEIPKVSGLRANRPNLTESVKRVDRTSKLVEDYYDLYDKQDVDEAKEAREAEIANAKLARIEKIVDLDAESVEDLQPTYVGKTIIQCPQCMTLFYKDPADIVHSEEDPEMVNVDEICQHCGNDTGYMVIGKVAAEEAPVEDVPAEEAQEESAEEIPAEESNEDEVAEEAPEVAEESEEDLDLAPAEEASEEEGAAEEEVKESLEAEEKPEEEEKSEEEKEELKESKDKELDKKLKLHNEYIDYLQKMIEQEESALKNTENEEVKAAIQRRLDGFKEDLQAALPEAVKDEIVSDNLPAADKIPVEEVEEKKESLEKTVDDDLNDKRVDAEKGEVKKLEENLNEAATAKKYNTYTNIMWDLVGGRVEKDEKGRNSYSHGCGYTVYDTGIDKDDNITVFAKTEAGLDNAIAVAKKYNHSYLGPMKANKPGYYMITIIIKPEDYEDGAFEEALKLEKCNKRIVESTSFQFAVKAEDWPEISNMAEQIGIKTVADLARFMKEEGQGKDLKTALFDYLNDELGLDFVATESCKEHLKEDEDISDAEYKQLLSSDEFKKPISEEEVEGYLEEDTDLADIEDFQESRFNDHVNKYLKEVYGNVKCFEAKDCKLENDKFIVEGIVTFNSGRTKNMNFTFNKTDKGILTGFSESLGTDNNFKVKFSVNKDKALITESLLYSYKIGDNLIAGETK